MSLSKTVLALASIALSGSIAEAANYKCTGPNLEVSVSEATLKGSQLSSWAVIQVTQAGVTKAYEGPFETQASQTFLSKTYFGAGDDNETAVLKMSFQEFCGRAGCWPGGTDPKKIMWEISGDAKLTIGNSVTHLFCHKTFQHKTFQ